MFELSYESFFVYNPGMLASYYRMDFLRKNRFRIALVVLSALGAVAAVSLVHWPWVSGLAAGAAAAGASVMLASLLSVQGVISYYFEKSISIHVHDEGLAFKLPDFTSQWTWSGIQTLDSHPDYLVFVRRGSDQPVLVPATALTHEVVAFILDKVRAAGGAVTVH